MALKITVSQAANVPERNLISFVEVFSFVSVQFLMEDIFLSTNQVSLSTNCSAANGMKRKRF
jgi:hypothetical protein